MRAQDIQSEQKKSEAKGGESSRASQRDVRAIVLRNPVDRTTWLCMHFM